MTKNPDRASRRAPEVPPGDDWLDRLAALYTIFGRFARDAAGVSLLAIALMSLLALWGLTRGVLLSPWARLLESWFGWGSYLVIVAIGFAGLRFLRRELMPWSLGQLIWFELGSLLTLGLLSVFGGNDLARADSGMDGGRLGWGIATLAWMLGGPIPGTILLLIAWSLAAMSAFGLWVNVESWLVKLAGDAPASSPSMPRTRSANQNSPPAAKAPAAKKNAEPAAKRPAPLPPEFRTSLRAPDAKAQRPTKPAPRDEALPPLQLLQSEAAARSDEKTINQVAGLIMKTLAEFGIPATVIGYRVGPAVTQFAVQPGFIKKENAEEDAQQMKVRVAQIAALERDLALALSAERLRIEAPVPGKPYVGIEVPNARASVVGLRAILESDVFHRVAAPLAMALGRDVSGQPLVADLGRMPHLLIAGSTGSGKSVCITSLAACLAMNNAPRDLRMVMIDSKMVELIRYNGLPHLYGKVETSLERILGVLRWVVLEMEHRYRLLEAAHARDLSAYNNKLVRRGDGTPLPRIVVLIDELADLMMSAPDQTEHNLVRLAQMARATGIHLIVATQRPSTDVVTGLIKANFPARLAFAVASGVDSRVILDTGGADTLLGRGDLLFLNPEVGNPVRAQGVMVTDMEIERIIAHWQKVSGKPVEETPPWEKLLNETDEGGDDGLIEQAISVVRASGRASASLLQRRLRVGYPRAARLLDQLEEMGIVGPSPGGGREREVLLSDDEETADEAD